MIGSGFVAEGPAHRRVHSSQTGRPVAELAAVTKEFRRGEESIVVVDHVDLTVEGDQSLAIIGASGSGKSTLLSIIGLLLSPEGGSLTFDGVETTELDQRERDLIRRRHIGYVFQQFHLVDYLDAFQNVALTLDHSAFNRSERRELVEAALAAVGLGHRLRHRPRELSGGECQRVAIARALVKEPRLLLADEPTGSLDQQSGRDFLATLDRARQNTTIVMVTHNPEVAAWADRTIGLIDGRVVGVAS